jgi:hypothetical protein
LKMSKIQGSKGRIDKSIIAILNMDSILNCFGPEKYESA